MTKVFISVIAVFLLVSCSDQMDSESKLASTKPTNWDEIQAVDAWLQEESLPNPKEVSSIDAFSSFSNKKPISRSIVPDKTDKGLDFIMPRECSPLWGYMQVGFLNQHKDSEFSLTQGNAWEKKYIDKQSDANLIFRIVADLAKSKKPIIELLTDEVNKCSALRWIMEESGQTLIWEYSYRVRKDSESRRTIISKIDIEDLMKTECVTVIEQLGRNLISVDLCKVSYTNDSPERIKKDESDGLIELIEDIKMKLLTNSG